MPDRLFGRVDLSECGEGVYLQATFPALAALEAEFGEFVFLDKLLFALPRLSPKVLSAMLKHCAFIDGKPAKAVWPDGERLEGLADKCLDALALGMRGKTHQEWVAEINAAQDKPKGENPIGGTAA